MKKIKIALMGVLVFIILISTAILGFGANFK